MASETEKKVVIIGVGNCGSQVAYLAEKRYGELFDCVYINTSESDLAMVGPSSLKYKIGDKDEVEGSGKNRTKMKAYLKKDVEKILNDPKLQDAIIDKKYGFIVVSAAGGTGSGAGPVLMDIMRQFFPDTHFVLVGVMPHMEASLMELGNTLEFTSELYEGLGDNTTYMIYDNDTTSDLRGSLALTAVNENIVEDIRILTGVDNYNTPYESIDEADMESIITTPGRLIVCRLTKGLTEKALEDNDLSEMLIKAIKKSAHAETDRNKVVLRWGIITYFTEAVNSLYSPNLDKLTDFIGTPIERFNHNAVHDGDEEMNFMYWIASGLSPINDRVMRIKKQIDKLKDALAKTEANKYVLEGDDSSYDVLTEKRRQARRDAAPSEFKVSDVFSKFGG